MTTASYIKKTTDMITARFNNQLTATNHMTTATNHMTTFSCNNN